jgi:hypothetical protein
MKAGNSGSDGEVSNFHLEVNPYWAAMLMIEVGTGSVVGCNINLRRCPFRPLDGMDFACVREI